MIHFQKLKGMNPLFANPTFLEWNFSMHSISLERGGRVFTATSVVKRINTTQHRSGNLNHSAHAFPAYALTHYLHG